MMSDRFRCDCENYALDILQRTTPTRTRKRWTFDSKRPRYSKSKGESPRQLELIECN